MSRYTNLPCPQCKAPSTRVRNDATRYCDGCGWMEPARAVETKVMLTNDEIVFAQICQLADHKRNSKEFIEGTGGTFALKPRASDFVIQPQFGGGVTLKFKHGNAMLEIVFEKDTWRRFMEKTRGM